MWQRFEDAQLGAADVSGARTPDREATLEGGLVTASSGPALAEAVRNFANAARVSSSVVFLAALVALLAETTGRARIPVWIPLANRCHDETEHVVGWLSNFHLVGFEVGLGWPALRLIETCRSILVAAQAHQELPLPLLWWRTGRVAERLSPRIVFSWRPAGAYDGGNVAFVRETAHSTPPIALAGFHLVATERPDDYAFSVEYPVRYFHRSTIDAHLSRYRRVVWRIVTAPEAALAAS